MSSTSNATRRSDLPRTLANALARARVAHAYLLAGPRGSDNANAAREFAAALVCQGGPDQSRPCGRCRSCELSAQGSHPDLSVLSPDGDLYSIKQIRQLIGELAERPLLAQRRVFILHDADRMRAEAANALLKTLEEPPPYGHLLLVSSHPEALPVTILSRCQLVRFAPPPLGEAAGRLHDVTAPGLARFLARETGGDRDHAASLAGECDLHGLLAQAFDLLLGARRYGEDWLLRAAERAEGYRREGDKLRLYIDLLAGVCRDAMALSLGVSAGSLDHGDRIGDLAQIRDCYNVSELAGMIEACEQTKDLLRKNVNTRLALEVLFLRLRARRDPGKGY